MNAPTGSLKGNPVSTPASGAAPRHTNLDAVRAAQFLKLLDPKFAGLTFQTFDDNQTRKNPELTRVVQSQDRSKLFQLHALGAGVFITVNETDGKGRKSENHARPRSFSGRRPRL
jgi:putative DNA primase/helicase